MYRLVNLDIFGIVFRIETGSQLPLNVFLIETRSELLLN